MPVAARSKAWVCGRSLPGIVGSNPAGGRDVYLLRMLCVVRWKSLRWADLSSRGILPIVTCLIAKLRNGGPWYGIGCKCHGGRRDTASFLSASKPKFNIKFAPICREFSLLFTDPVHPKYDPIRPKCRSLGSQQLAKILGDIEGDDLWAVTALYVINLLKPSGYFTYHHV